MFTRFINWIKSLMIHIAVLGSRRSGRGRGRRGQGGSAGPPVIGASGQRVLGAVSTAVPMQWDAARVYSGSGFASPDAQWRATKIGLANLVANPEWIFADTTKNGGVSPPSSAQYAPGNGSSVDLMEIVPSSLVNGIPSFRFKWLPCTGSPNGAIGSSPQSAQVSTHPSTTSRRVWMGRRVVHAKGSQISGGHDWDTTGAECVNQFNTQFNLGGTVANVFTITNAITVTGSQTVLVSDTSQIRSANQLNVDSGANAETITSWTIVDSTHLTANFTKTHAAGISVGTTITAASGAGFKDGPYIESGNITTARCGVSGLVGATYSGPGTLDGTYQLDGDFANDGASPAIIMGFTDKATTTASTIDNAFNNGLIYDVVVLCELLADGSANDWTATRYWRRAVNSDFSVGSWKRVGSYVVADMFDTNGGTGWHNGFVFNQVQFTSKNHNRAIEALRYRDISEWGAFDATNPNADGSDDPWGCLAADAAQVPEVLNAASLTSTAVGSALFSLTRTTSGSVPSFASKIRMVIGGVDNPSSDDIVLSFIYNDTDAIPFTWTQAPGTYNVQFKTVSGDGTQVSAAFPSTPINVVIPASLIPLAPTQGNATAATPNSLTFSVTLNASGALPTALALQTSTDGGVTWTAGLDTTLTSPSLGQVITVVIAVPTANQLYNVEFAEKNTHGTSAWSAKTTGTTSASANTARASLALTNGAAPLHPTVSPASLSSVLPLATNAWGGEGWKNFNGAAAGATPFVTAPAGASVSLQYGGWVSDGLVAGTVPAGTYTIAIGLYTTGTGTFNAAFSLHVFRPSTGTIVGTVYDSATGLGSALTVRSTGGKVITFTGAAVVAQAGDILALEMFAVGTGSAQNIHIAYGSGGATITEGCDVGTFEHSVLTFPSSITFEV